MGMAGYIVVYWIVLVISGSSIAEDVERSYNGEKYPSDKDVGEPITFYLYTRENPSEPQILEMNDKSSVFESFFNPDHSTRVVIHGWLGNLHSPVNQYIKAAYLSVGEYNVIAVDYSSIAGLPYVWAKNKVATVGQYIAKFIDFLSYFGYMTFKDLQLIGHSLGGQICGLVGRHVRNGRVSVIHALDPAGPYFDDGNENTLRPSDAEYVQVIITSAFSFGYGSYKYQLGHVVFHPAYGKSQPECGPDMSCSHFVCVNYFVEAILNPTAFPATKCRSAYDVLKRDYCKPTGLTAYMGTYSLPFKYYGVYYVPVNSNPPFGQSVQTKLQYKYV